MMVNKMCPILMHGVMGVTAATAIAAQRSATEAEEGELADATRCLQDECQWWWFCQEKMPPTISHSLPSQVQDKVKS